VEFLTMLMKALRFCETLGIICPAQRNVQEETNTGKRFSGEADIR
jgi:hypothetical protein